MYQEDQPKSIGESLHLQDDEALISDWPQSVELQEEIAANLYLITDSETAMSLYDFFSQRFDKADEIEKSNIIKAMEALGARCPNPEVITAEYLTNIYNKSNATEVVWALKSKVVRATLPGDSDEMIQSKMPIINMAGQLFVRELERDDLPRELRFQLLTGIYRCQYSPELNRKIQEILEKSAVSDDEQESLFAIGEMTGMRPLNQEVITKCLIKKFESGWVVQASDDDISKIITIAGHSGDPMLRPYLLDLKIHPRLINNERQQKNIDWALKTLAEKEQGEK